MVAGDIGGPGESQLEIDRRLTDKRITKLHGEIGEYPQNTLASAIVTSTLGTPDRCSRRIYQRW